jgi:hypothetical protein
MELDRPGQDDNGQTKTWRLRSVMISALTLLFSLAIIFCAALLQSSYSYGGA